MPKSVLFSIFFIFNRIVYSQIIWWEYTLISGGVPAFVTYSHEYWPSNSMDLVFDGSENENSEVLTFCSQLTINFISIFNYLYQYKNEILNNVQFIYALLIIRFLPEIKSYSSSIKKYIDFNNGMTSRMVNRRCIISTLKILTIC